MVAKVEVIGYIIAAVAALLVITNAATWHFTSQHEAEKLAAFKADVKAKGEAKEDDNARVQAAAVAAAAKVSADASIAAGIAWAQLEAADQQLALMGGRVRNLADANRVLRASAGRSEAPQYPPAPVRGYPSDSGPDLPGRLIACEDALTVSTATMKWNNYHHNLALGARDACVKQYEEVRKAYNE